MNKQEFKALYDLYFDSIRSYIYYKSGDQNLASDIAQDVFMKVWNKRERLDSNNIKGLLYKMASDQFINEYRKSKVSETHLNSLSLDPIENNSMDSIEFKELKSIYEYALAQLTEKHRTVFLMSRMEQLTYKEIAERLEISVKAVEKRMSKTLSELKLKLNY